MNEHNRYWCTRFRCLVLLQPNFQNRILSTIDCVLLQHSLSFYFHIFSSSFIADCHAIILYISSLYFIRHLRYNSIPASSIWLYIFSLLDFLFSNPFNNIVTLPFYPYYYVLGVYIVKKWVFFMILVKNIRCSCSWAEIN